MNINPLQNRTSRAWVIGGLLSVLAVAGYSLMDRPGKSESAAATLATGWAASLLPQPINTSSVSSPCMARRKEERWRVNCANATLAELATILQRESNVIFSYPPTLGTHPISVVADDASLEHILDIALASFNFAVIGNSNSPYANIAIVGLKNTASTQVAQASSSNFFGRIVSAFGGSSDTSPSAQTPFPFSNVSNQAAQSPGGQQPLTTALQIQPQNTPAPSKVVPRASSVEAERIVSSLNQVAANTHSSVIVPTAPPTDTAKIVGDLNRATSRPTPANVPVASRTDAAKILDELKQVTGAP
jgi:hypothetical protein